jgi:hypothetical protein
LNPKNAINRLIIRDTASIKKLVSSNFRYKLNLIDSTIYVNGLYEEILNNKIDESFIFHSGYKAELRKNIGKITKFITVAKFSNCFITDDIKRAKAFNIIDDTIITGIVTKIARLDISTP